MKKLKCECCGASLTPDIKRHDIFICEYCGMRYKEDSSGTSYIRIETFQNPIKTLCVKEMIDDDIVKCIGEERSAEMAMRDITHKLAESLGDCIRLEKMYDPMRMKHVITARVRVVEDSYKF